MCVCARALLEPGFVCLRIRQLQPLPWAPTPDLLKHPLLYFKLYACVWWEMAIDASSHNANMQMNFSTGCGVTGVAPPLNSIQGVIQYMCVLFVRAAFK